MTTYEFIWAILRKAGPKRSTIETRYNTCEVVYSNLHQGLTFFWLRRYVYATVSWCRVVTEWRQRSQVGWMDEGPKMKPTIQAVFTARFNQWAVLLLWWRFGFLTQNVLSRDGVTVAAAVFGEAKRDDGRVGCVTPFISVYIIWNIAESIGRERSGVPVRQDRSSPWEIEAEATPLSAAIALWLNRYWCRRHCVCCSCRCEWSVECIDRWWLWKYHPAGHIL